jgi:hypothetical protein
VDEEAAKKVAKKKVAKRSRFAGRVALPLAGVADKVITLKVDVDTEDFTRLQEAIVRASDVAGRVESAAKAIANHKDPNHKQLHRRVRVLVYDAAGTRISNSISDLTRSDVLTLKVDCDNVDAKTVSVVR